MDYCRLYASLRDDPKMLSLPDRAFRRHIEAMCWVTEHETDGRIPQTLMPEREASALLEAGLWERVGSGYEIHGWLGRQRSKAEMDAKRIAGRIASRKRWGNGSPTSEPNATPNAEVEVEVETKSKDFIDFWNTYPRKVGKRAARAAFEKALKRALVDEIVAGAKRYALDPNRDGQFTAHPTTWLNRDGWEDDPLPAKGTGPAPAEREPEYFVAPEVDDEAVAGFAAAAAANPPSWNRRKDLE